MTTVVQNVNYTGKYQTLTVTQAFGGSMTAYLWGAGGGGGPGDGWHGIGGAGGGGGYAKVTFAVNPGDIVGIAVGQYGTRGVGGSGYGGGAAGASYNAVVWDSLSLLSTPGIVRAPLSVYPAFLNQYGVWNTDVYSSTFDQTASVNFPVNGTYQFTASCDNQAYIYVDGVQVLNTGGDWHAVPTVNVYVNAGNHNVRLYGINWGGPASVALSITGYSASYSGAVGGNPGSGGSSGGGGGGGGATVLTLNGTVIGVAGGGGGGGGAGQWSYVSQCDAPGLNQHSVSESSGQAGENLYGDGGGGGAGGGGYRGGNGGPIRGGEATGYGGAYGTSYSINGVTENPNGRNPGGLSNPLKPASIGTGGSGYNPFVGSVNTNGTSGAAVFEFNFIGSFINNGTQWIPIRDIFLHHNNQWNTVKNIYMNVNGEWKTVVSSTTNIPQFVSRPSNFGVSYRPYPYTPPDPSPE